MREVDAGKGAGAEIVRTMRGFVCPLIPFRIAGNVLGLLLVLLLLLLAALVEHLFEELKLS